MAASCCEGDPTQRRLCNRKDHHQQYYVLYSWSILITPPSQDIVGTIIIDCLGNAEKHRMVNFFWGDSLKTANVLHHLEIRIVNCNPLNKRVGCWWIGKREVVFLKMLHLACINRDTMIGEPCGIRPHEIKTTAVLCLFILSKDVLETLLVERGLITTLFDSKRECFLNAVKDGTIANGGERIMHQ